MIKANKQILSTIQFDCGDNDLNEFLLKDSFKNLENSLFKILYANEYFPYLRFKDIGAIVYFAKVIEWEFPNFSVEDCFDKLCKLNEDINIKGYIESFEHRYIVVCKKQK